MTTPFRVPAFRRLWFSTVGSIGAQGLERTLTAWLALEIGATAFEIGLIFAIRMLPSLLFGLAAGTIADRADRTRQLFVVAVASSVAMGLFGWLVATSTIHIWQIMALGFISGCIQTFDIPARQALVLDTVSNDTAQRALALNALAGRFAGAFGAILAGILISQIGITYSYGVVATIYTLVALLMVSLHVPQEHRGLAEPQPFCQAFMASIQMAINIPVLRTLILIGLICEIFAFSHISALPLFAQQALAAGPTGLGTLNAALSIGGAIAVGLLSLLPERVPRQPVLGAIFLTYGLSIIVLSTTRNLVAAVAVTLVIGCCAAAFDVLQQTLIQMAVPPEQRGRAVGLWVLSIGSAPIGHLEMGALATALGVPIALLLNGALTLFSAALLLVRSPEYRLQRYRR